LPEQLAVQDPPVVLPVTEPPPLPPVPVGGGSVMVCVGEQPKASRQKDNNKICKTLFMGSILQ
jgi:hypothetical protein